MQLIDLYFLTFNEYRKKTKDFQEAVKVRNVIKKSNSNNDELTTIKYHCEIEEDWIKNIEHGLIFIEKAIQEERQFIRTEGDVVQIEKVKKVSRESVEHLSRNSKLITKVPKDGEMLIPEKLYVVEKLNDYAVYENRFIYLLLTYLEEFVHSRLEKIEKKVTTYQSSMKINKIIDLNNRQIHFKLNLLDEYEKDPFRIDVYKNLPHLKRLEIILYSVRSLLRTPLMLEVSKKAMIRPPIVKTNVLRMNPNFRAALELYDYITSYNKDGYSFEEFINIHSPFDGNLGDEFAEVIELSTFLSYQYGNEITEYLNEVFLKEEERLKIESELLMKSELKRLKKRVQEMNMGYESYMLLLEKRNIDLEKENAELNLIKNQHDYLTAQFKELEEKNNELISEIENLNRIIEEKVTENQYLNEKYFRDMTLLESDHRVKVEHLKNTHALELSQLDTLHQNEIQELNQEYQSEISHIVAQANKDKQNIVDRYENINSNLKNEMNLINDSVANLNAEKLELIRTNEQRFIEQKDNFHAEIIKLNNKVEEITDEKNHIMGNFYAMKQQQGLITKEDSFTSREKFQELTNMKKAFNKFIDEQWKVTKQKIREEVHFASKMQLRNELLEKKRKKTKKE